MVMVLLDFACFVIAKQSIPPVILSEANESGGGGLAIPDSSTITEQTGFT